MTVIVRSAQREDIPVIQAIYAPYVLTSTMTAEYVPPTIAEMEMGFQTVLETGLPYLVIEEVGQVLGYAYATPFSPRVGFQFVAQLSIYLAEAAQGQGLGQLLYTEIEQRLQAQGKRQLIALITHENEASIAFHQKNGFKQIGEFKEAMYKFDRFTDLLWWVKSI